MSKLIITLLGLLLAIPAMAPANAQRPSAQSPSAQSPGAQGQKERAWCVNRETTISTTPEAQMKVAFPGACVLSQAPNPSIFLQINYGGLNKPCRC